MRDGSYICTFKNSQELTEEDLISKMVGYDLSGSLYQKKVFFDASANRIAYEVDGLHKKNALEPTSFHLHHGEIVGFFGLEGCGSNTLSRMLYGLERRDGGSFILDGKLLTKILPATLLENKVVYLNNNRKKSGLLLNSATTDNMILPVSKKMSKGSILQKQKIIDYTQRFIDLFSIAIPTVFQKPKNLSGGNQQKLMLSICLGTEPNLFIVNEPTRGIDVSSKSEIHKLLLKTSDSGVGILVFSSELPELMSLCDRIYVMKNNRLTGCVCGDDITETSIMALAAGELQKEAAK